MSAFFYNNPRLLVVGSPMKHACFIILESAIHLALELVLA
jgi:hypothetical protein